MAPFKTALIAATFLVVPTVAPAQINPCPFPGMGCQIQKPSSSEARKRRAIKPAPGPVVAVPGPVAAPAPAPAVPTDTQPRPATPSNAQTSDKAQIVISPAPDGEAVSVARQIILENFDPPDCPVVVRAARLSDGSIKAFCNNGESYFVFMLATGGQPAKRMALRCSAAHQIGIAC